MARMGETRGVYRVLVERTDDKETTWKNPGVEGRIILRWIFKKWDGEIRLD